jgi:hypothetical protein
VSEHDDDDNGRQRDVADQMQRAHPGWMVVFGSYSRMFWAFPPFGPRGGYFAAADSGDPERRIRAAETSYLRTGGRDALGA